MHAEDDTVTAGKLRGIDSRLNVSMGRPSGRSSTYVIMIFAKGQLKKKGFHI